VNEKNGVNLQEIKAEILKCLRERGVTVKRIILFGSRARGDAGESSDYDFLIVTKETFPVKEKMRMATALRRTLARLYVPVDVVINSEEEVDAKKDKIGYVTRYALREGIEI